MKKISFLVYTFTLAGCAPLPMHYVKLDIFPYALSKDSGYYWRLKDTSQMRLISSEIRPDVDNPKKKVEVFTLQAKKAGSILLEFYSIKSSDPDSMVYKKFKQKIIVEE